MIHLHVIIKLLCTLSVYVITNYWHVPIIGTSMNGHWLDNIREIATCSLEELMQRVRV